MVEHPLRLGVAGVVHLEAAVQRDVVDEVGADPPTDGIRRLMHLDLDPGGTQVARTGQSGQAGTDDDDLGHAATLPVDNFRGGWPILPSLAA